MAIEDAVEHVQGFQGHDGLGSLQKEYVTFQSPNIHDTIGPGGRRAVEFSTSEYIEKSRPAANGEIYYGVRYYKTSSTAEHRFLKFGESTTEHGSVGVLTDGRLHVRRGTTFIAFADISTALMNGTWYYISVYYLCHDSTGRFVVKVNGTTVIDFTGDTRNASSGNITWWRAGQMDGGAGTVVYMTDLVVLDGTHVDADFVPDGRVDSLFPAAEGDIIEGTPSTGTDNAALVNEISSLGGDYVSFLAAGEEDLYTLDDLPSNPGTVYGVALVIYADKTDAGDCSLQTQMKASGGTVTAATAHPMSTTPLMYFDWYPDEPGGAGWDGTAVNGLQIGVNRTL